MIKEYKGNYIYNCEVVNGWNSSAIGVYYCGFLKPENKNILIPLYIGIGTGEQGIRGRLIDHLREEHWPNVTHFGYCLCGTATEAENLEKKEIDQYQPKYNKQGK